MKAKIQQRARELGFDNCRVTTAQRPETAHCFERWLAAEHHGEMAYMERNARQRVDPQSVLCDARSIVTLAASYEMSTGRPHDSQSEAPKPPDTQRFPRATLTCGLIARYARFADYHHVLGAQLKLLAQFVNELGAGATRSLWYVDTGPLLERDLAQRSGLGFVGKHTNLISRQLGNWIFLAEIITTLELEPDAPEKNRCGSCVRCLAACPTQAIIAPFHLDARRCISYLTIELKGSIPLEFRSALGNRIFGCDDCLAVCPWNRFAREGQLMKDHARPDLAEPDLLELLAFDDPSFKRRFADTPIVRVKRRGLLRNVCVALGNVARASALPALRRAAHDPEPLIVEHALWAIEQIQAREQPSPV